MRIAICEMIARRDSTFVAVAPPPPCRSAGFLPTPHPASLCPFQPSGLCIYAMDEVEQAFEAATQYVGASAAGGTLSDALLLKFYGLYKQATAGPCNAPKPSFFDRRGRAKWQAWKDAARLSAEEAQRQYVQLLTEASLHRYDGATLAPGLGAHLMPGTLQFFKT